jgi:hypothetical protein
MHAVDFFIVVLLFLVIIQERYVQLSIDFIFILSLGSQGPSLQVPLKWYEFYYDVAKSPGGQYWLEVDKMHDRYGQLSDLLNSNRSDHCL